MLNTDFEYLRTLFQSTDSKNLKTIVPDLLCELASSDLLADSFFYHPLGFIYSTLHTFENGETIRIHIWDKKIYDIVPQLDIHNHYYRVNSFVFRGCVYNQLYIIDDDISENVSQYKGSYSPSGDRILTKTNEGLYVKEDQRSTYCADNLYTINHDQIHSGGALGPDITCTLVYTQSPGDRHPLVFGRGELPEILYFNKKKVENEVVNSILKELTNDNQITQ